MPQLFWHTMVKWASETGSEINDAAIQSLHKRREAFRLHRYRHSREYRTIAGMLVFRFYHESHGVLWIFGRKITTMAYL